MKIEPADLSEHEIHDLLMDVMAPLPVVLISTIGEDGVYNAAPFSFVMPVCNKPPIICVSIGLRQGQKKDTMKNIEFSNDFVINTVDETLARPMARTEADYPPDVDEIKEAGLTAEASERVKSPRIAESAANLECRLVQNMELGEGEDLRNIIFGEVLLVHVKDEVMVRGRIEPTTLRSIGRVAPRRYCRTADFFRVEPPRDVHGHEHEHIYGRGRG